MSITEKLPRSRRLNPGLVRMAGDIVERAKIEEKRNFLCDKELLEAILYGFFIGYANENKIAGLAGISAEYLKEILRQGKLEFEGNIPSSEAAFFRACQFCSQDLQRKLLEKAGLNALDSEKVDDQIKLLNAVAPGDYTPKPTPAVNIDQSQNINLNMKELGPEVVRLLRESDPKDMQEWILEQSKRLKVDPEKLLEARTQEDIIEIPPEPEVDGEKKE